MLNSGVPFLERLRRRLALVQRSVGCWTITALGIFAKSTVMSYVAMWPVEDGKDILMVAFQSASCTDRQNLPIQEGKNCVVHRI